MADFAPPELPASRSVDAIERDFVRHRAVLPRETWDELRERAAARWVSEYAVVLSSAAQVLAMWSKSARFSVTVQFGARPESRLTTTPGESRCAVVGFDRGRDARFGDEAAALQRDTIAWLDEKSLPVRKLGALLDKANETGTLVLFTSRLSRGFLKRGEAKDVLDERPASRMRTALTITAQADAAGLIVEFAHAHGRLDDGDAAEMTAALERLLKSLAQCDSTWEQTTAELGHTLLPPEQARVRAATNATAAPIPAGVLFTGFLAQVASHPDAPAIITSDRTLSYDDVHRLACALAHKLVDCGVATNQLVAIIMPKSWAQVVAALGIQLAGGAYLPVDSELPVDRVRFLIEHGEARAIVTLHSLRGELEFGSTLPVFELDRLEPAPAGTRPPAIEVRPEDLAYVIFTSGSTGLPKGVMIDHRGAWNTAIDVNTRLRVTANDRVLALSRLSFDLSVYDIFGLLAAGGAIVIPDADLVRDPAHWSKLVRDHRVTLWNTVPALMQLFVDFLNGRTELAGFSLRCVMMSGDWIPLTLPPQVRSLWPRTEVVSMGGATEASIWSIIFPIEDVDRSWKSIPYGKPMVNQTFHVLHADLSPCPDNVVGELCIGGVGVALGYWKDRGKSAARFITHPRTGERLYRTGDLGRYFPDGNIEFLGREDFQVKVQGFRIELGEIESHLAAHPGVRRAVVAAIGDTDSGRRLVSYIVPSFGPRSGAGELRAHLRARLPEYMVPAEYVFLEQLPLTANGKVNLKALPAPSQDGDPHREHVAPRTRTERILFDIWKASLGFATFGVLDNYFEIGGGSLAGTRMIFKIRDAVRRDVPVRILFEHPTIAKMAVAIDALSGAAQTAEDNIAHGAPPMRGHGPGTPLFFVPGVGGIEYLPRALTEVLPGNRAFCDMLLFPGVDGKQAPLTSVEAIATDLVRQIRLAQPRGPYAICGFCIGGTFAYEVARQLEQAGETVTSLILWHGYTEHSMRRRNLLEICAVLARWVARAEQGNRFALLSSKLHLAFEQGANGLANRLRPLVGKKRKSLIDELDWLPPDTDKRVVDANFAACRAYHPKPYRGRVAMLVGDTDRLTIAYQPLFGWDGQLSAAVEIFKFPVEHLQLIEEPMVQALARQTCACLDAADRGLPSPVAPGSRAARTVND